MARGLLFGPVVLDQLTRVGHCPWTTRPYACGEGSQACFQRLPPPPVATPAREQEPPLLTAETRSDSANSR
jgi:hypothetical protein